MKVLYGISNLAKLQHMRDMLHGMNIEIIGLNDIGISMDMDNNHLNEKEINNDK